MSESPPEEKGQKKDEARPEPLEIERSFPAELLDDDAVRVIRRLVDHGHEAYLVGGCVRDLLFELRPKDFDIVTSALPNEIRRIFRNCRIIGRRFRLAHVYFRDKVLEVATFRAGASLGEAEASAREEAADDALVAAPTPLDLDDESDERQQADEGEEGAPESDDEEAEAEEEREDGRSLLIRDDNVFGTKDEDALRRDFTINALFYDIARGIIVDYVGGVDDAERRVVRSIGEPMIRVQEDPIRILRAIRLAARLGCTIDPPTWQAMLAHRERILEAARPRVQEELLRMFSGGAMSAAFDMMRGAGVLEIVLPELHAVLERGDAEKREREVAAIRRLLAQADRRTRSGKPLTQAVRLALLLAPIVLAPEDEREKTQGSPSERASRAMRPIAERLAISRKDGERVRQVLLSLEKMLPQPKSRSRSRRRRGGSTTLLRRSYFPETLELFEIVTGATGDLVEEAERWQRRYAEEVPEGPPPPEPRRSSRRRRRRR